MPRARAPSRFLGVDVTAGHYRPRDLVSWTCAIDPYTFYVFQVTIAAMREPFEMVGRNALNTAVYVLVARQLVVVDTLQGEGSAGPPYSGWACRVIQRRTQGQHIV